MHLVWGRRDPWYPAPLARLTAAASGARLHWVESGHFAPWEAPGGFSEVLVAIGDSILRER